MKRSLDPEDQSDHRSQITDYFYHQVYGHILKHLTNRFSGGKAVRWNAGLGTHSDSGKWQA